MNIEDKNLDGNAMLMHFNTLPASGIKMFAKGSFTEPDVEEFACLGHDTILLYRLESSGNRTLYRLIDRTPTFTILSNLVTVPSQGGSLANAVGVGGSAYCNLLAVTSDSGYLSLLRYEGNSTSSQPFKGMWITVGNELIGKSGARLTVSGCHLAVDPLGRALFVAAPMRDKLIFPLKCEPGEREVSLGSPLEARRATVVYTIAPVETSVGNPTFAVLEEPIDDSSVPMDGSKRSKQVAFYYLDTNLNQVIRGLTVLVPDSTSFLAPCPVAYNAPGVLVCCDSAVFWLSCVPQSRGVVFNAVPLPVPSELTPLEVSKIMIVSSCYLALDDDVVFLIQSEHGDIYRVRLGRDRRSLLTIHYFDTIVISNSIGIATSSNKGYLFSAGETGQHSLFMIKNREFPSNQYPAGPSFRGYVDACRAEVEVPTFVRRPHFNLLLRQGGSNGASTTGLLVRLEEGRAQFSTVSGKGLSSRFNIISHGIEAKRENEKTLDFPKEDCPLALFCLRGESLRFIVSHRTSTSVWAVQNSVTRESPEAFPFALNESTLYAGALNDNTFVQVTERGIYTVRCRKREIASQTFWSLEEVKEIFGSGRKIAVASGNPHHVYIGLSPSRPGEGGVISFQFSPQKGVLIFCSYNKEIVATAIHCPALRPSQPSVISQIVGIGLVDGRFSIYNTMVQKISKRSLECADKAAVKSICMTYLGDDTNGKMYALVGSTAKGRVHRVKVDPTTGALSDADDFPVGHGHRCRLIPGDGETFCYVQADGLWRCYVDANGGFICMPVNEAPRRDVSACRFFFLVSGGHLMGVEGNVLTRFSVDTFSGSSHTTSSVPLRLTPRRILKHPQEPLAVVLESEFRSSANRFDSAIQIIDLNHQFCHPKEVYLDNESITAMSIGNFSSIDCGPVLVVTVVKGFRQDPVPQWENSSIIMYRFHTENYSPPSVSLDIVTSRLLSTVDYPTAVHVTSTGHLLVGMGPGNELTMFGFQKTFLKQRTLKGSLRSRVVAIESLRTPSPYETTSTNGPSKNSLLIVLGTADQSVALVKYHDTIPRGESSELSYLILVGRDTVPRMVVTMALVDCSTIAISDRFGSVTILKIPSSLITDIPDQYAVHRDLLESRAAQPLECVAQFNVGQLVTSLQTISVSSEYCDGSVDGGERKMVDVLVYGTILGCVGCLVPFQREEDAVLSAFALPEIKSRFRSLVNRSINSYQSAFYQHKGVVNGDLLQILVGNKELACLDGEDREAILKDIENMKRKSNKQLEQLLEELPREFDSIEGMLSKMKGMSLHFN